MNFHNLKTGLRTLYRNKLYTVLNVLGLSVGMASAILIFLWVQFQISFDRFHENTELIYRVIQDQYYSNDEVFHVEVTPTALAKAMKENLPQISQTTRYNMKQSLFEINEETKAMENVQLVDPDFFRMFSFPLIKGDPGRVLEKPRSMVISEKIAGKYFGKTDPVGKTVILEGEFPFTITGVIRDNPKNTEISCDILIPFEFYKELGENTETFQNNWITTYVQLLPGISADSVNKGIDHYKKIHFPDSKTIFFLQPLKRIHLFWIWGGGPIRNVRLFSIIAAILILIAAINFTNLSTAMSAKRFTEIGIKKSFGAGRKALFRQFITETLILSAVSMFIALILAESFLTWYNNMLQTQLKIRYNDVIMVAGFFVIMIITGFLSGLYPALYLSSFKPIRILKSNPMANKKSFLRESLVVIQFALAIILIVNTIIVKKQHAFLQKQEVGFQRDNILFIPLRGNFRDKFEFIKSELEKVEGVKSVTFSSHVPATIYSNGGGYDWAGKSPEINPLVSNTMADYDYLETFGMTLKEGEFYARYQYTDTNNIVINNTFAEIIGIKPIIGEYIKAWGRQMKIIGVVNDFNFKPLYSKVEPLIILNITDWHQYVFCKLSAENMPQTIKKIGDVHERINGAFPFEYHFVDADFEQMYNAEQRQGRIFNVFSFLAIFISCLGLFGLSSFMMTQRTKEIGIRKTNGATALHIMVLFGKYYIRWILVSFVLAVPVSYFLIEKWLKNYAYKTDISWWVFVLAGLLAIVISVITVGGQSWKAARRNPIDALHYE
jgi:ABC-type antimicrobial peptide transport system permease subunit